MKLITIKHNEFRLLPEKVIHWVNEDALLIADLHLGKSNTFSHYGIYIPTGTTDSDLKKLNKIIFETKIKRIIFLGDLLHHKVGYNNRVKSELKKWREENNNLEIILVRGNHDKKAGDPEEELEFKCYDEPYRFADFEFRHFPPKESDNFCFSGHIHPSVILRGKGNQYYKAPCFYFSEKYCLLPSFGTFTGSSKINVKRGDKVYIVVEGKVIEIPDREL